MEFKKLLETRTGIQKANLITALRMGLIDWFQFFTGWRAISEEECEVNANTEKKAA